MTHPAYAIADELKEDLAPGCKRIEIAGSLRRLKITPRDIEMVCQPLAGVWTISDMFGAGEQSFSFSALDDRLRLLYESGAWRLDTELKRDGPNYKRLRHSPSDICCDLFIVTDPRKWGIIFTIRTGSRHFSENLVTRAQGLGGFVQHGLLHQHQPPRNEMREVQECPAGEQCPHIRPTLEEHDFFEALDLPWIEPAEREGYLTEDLIKRARSHELVRSL